MKLLLGTHLLLRAAGQPDRLSKEGRAVINAPENELFFSAASLREVVISEGLVEKISKRTHAYSDEDCSTTDIANCPSAANTWSLSRACLPYTKIRSTAFLWLRPKWKESRC